MDLSTAQSVVIRAIRTVFEQNGDPVPQNLTSDTVLVGPDAVIDSLGVVSLIVEVEQIVEAEHNASIILANDKAMSAKNSPFRTVGVLAQHVIATIEEAKAA
jgi:acyl carrier protein